jgi:ABC-2 type transport system permease protein
MSDARAYEPSLGQAGALFRRELGAYFLSPMAYVVWVVFLVACGYLFATSLRDGGTASLDNALTNMSLLLLFVVPLLTMRLVAEELRLGTLELLLTDPISDAAIIIAKYAAAVVFFGVMVLPTAAYPLVLLVTGQPDPGPLLAGYLGLLLSGALFVAVGLAASALASHQIAAAALSFVVLFLFWILGRAADTLSPGVLRDVLDYLSAFSRFAAFRRGLVDTRSVIYCVSLTALCLFAAVRGLGLRRLK